MISSAQYRHPSYHKLQQYAIAISIASIIYNGAEGAVSIGLGADASSRSLVFFGIQSGIEVISSVLVVWRFWNVKPGEEGDQRISERELRFERIATTSTSILLLLLAIGTLTTSILGLVQHSEPHTSTLSLIVSASALGCMILIWLPKRYLARALNSSAMQAETQCSLSCIQITAVLFIGSLVFKVWKGGWWVDSATALVLGLLFGWEGWKMLRWARSKEFDGGCCGHCRIDRGLDLEEDGKVELGERYRDLCECCSEKEECRNSDVCQCSSSCSTVTTPDIVPGMVEIKTCCVPVNAQGGKCCSHDYLSKPAVVADTKPQETCCATNAQGSSCCSQSQSSVAKSTNVVKTQETCCAPTKAQGSNCCSQNSVAKSTNVVKARETCCATNAQGSNCCSQSQSSVAKSTNVVKAQETCCATNAQGSNCCNQSSAAKSTIGVTPSSNSNTILDKGDELGSKRSTLPSPSVSASASGCSCCE